MAVGDDVSVDAVRLNWNPLLHPRSPRTGKFVERPWDLPSEFSGVAEMSVSELLASSSLELSEGLGSEYSIDSLGEGLVSFEGEEHIGSTVVVPDYTYFGTDVPGGEYEITGVDTSQNSDRPLIQVDGKPVAVRDQYGVIPEDSEGDQSVEDDESDESSGSDGDGRRFPESDYGEYGDVLSAVGYPEEGIAVEEFNPNPDSDTNRIDASEMPVPMIDKPDAYFEDMAAARYDGPIGYDGKAPLSEITSGDFLSFGGMKVEVPIGLTGVDMARIYPQHFMLGSELPDDWSGKDPFGLPRSDVPEVDVEPHEWDPESAAPGEMALDSSKYPDDGETQVLSQEAETAVVDRFTELVDTSDVEPQETMTGEGDDSTFPALSKDESVKARESISELADTINEVDGLEGDRRITDEDVERTIDGFRGWKNGGYNDDSRRMERALQNALGWDGEARNDILAAEPTAADERLAAALSQVSRRFFEEHHGGEMYVQRGVRQQGANSVVESLVDDPERDEIEVTESPVSNTTTDVGTADWFGIEGIRIQRSIQTDDVGMMPDMLFSRDFEIPHGNEAEVWISGNSQTILLDLIGQSGSGSDLEFQSFVQQLANADDPQAFAEELYEKVYEEVESRHEWDMLG
jgi:hypothetical protein